MELMLARPLGFNCTSSRASPVDMVRGLSPRAFFRASDAESVGSLSGLM